MSLAEVSGYLLENEEEPSFNISTTETDVDIAKSLVDMKTLLQQVRDKIIGDWLGEAYQRKITQKAAEHKKKIKSLKDELISKQKQLEKLKQEKESIIKEQTKETSRKKALEARLKDIQKETDRILLDKEQSEKYLEKLQETITKLEQAVADRHQSTKQSVQTIEREQELFKTRLGLQLKNISGERLQFVFTCLDAKDPSRPFCFCVKINSDKSYTDCKPEVDGLDQLVSKLQSTNNFRSFVIAMRQKFQNLLL